MRYSIQQIKYEFLYAIKEFDSDGRQWQIAMSDVAPADMLKSQGEDPEAYVFVGKPAGTARAAELVRDFFVDRYEVAVSSDQIKGNPDGDWIVLFRSKASLPRLAVPL